MYQLKREDLKENIAIIKINKSYHEGMSALELYDVTRGCWKRKLESVKPAEYVLSVSFGEVKEVYKVDSWVPSSELNRETIPFDAELEKGRIGFNGKVAEEQIRQKYINKSVSELFKRGEADPVKVFLVDGLKTKTTGDINTPAKPIIVIQTEDEPIVVCPRCEESFSYASRCPECGQLIMYKEKWNKKKLGSLEEWEQVSKLIGVDAKDVGAFVRELTSEDCISYHIGAVDLSIDITDTTGKKIMQVMMLIGKGDTGAIQPSGLMYYAEQNGLNQEAVNVFLERMKPLLSKHQKCKPYERTNGYYWIEYKTILENKREIVQSIVELKNSLT